MTIKAFFHWIAVLVAVLCIIAASNSGQSEAYLKAFRRPFEGVLDILKDLQNGLSGSITLATKYASFSLEFEQEKPTILQQESSDTSLRALRYEKMKASGATLGPEQEEKYQNYLKLRADKLRSSFKKQLAYAKKVADQFDCDKQDWSQLKQENKSADIDTALQQKSATSKIYIKCMDKQLKEPVSVAIVVPVHEEFKRLKRPELSILGEDFLAWKFAELTALFEGTTKFEWKLIFVDDYAPNAGKKLSIDAIREELTPGMKNRVLLWSYKDLAEQIQFFPETVPKDLDAFARASVKGGAIYASLKKLVSEASEFKPDVIVMTDADISASLMQTGLLLKPLFPFDSKDSAHTHMAIGSRRLSDSYMVRAEDRNFNSVMYNLMTRLVFGLKFKDTQMGFKAMLPRAIKSVAPKFSTLGMAFDVELLYLVQKNKGAIMEVGCVYIDSAEESQSVNQGFNMFQQLFDIYSLHIRPLATPDNRSGKSARELLAATSLRLSKSPYAEQLRKLALNKELNVLVRYANLIYQLMAPTAFKRFIDSCVYLFETISRTGDVSDQDIQNILTLFKDIVDNSSIDVQKFYHFLFDSAFPELTDVLQILVQDHDKAAVATTLLKMLSGQNIITSLIGAPYCPTMFSLQQQGSNGDLFKAWPASCVDQKLKALADREFVGMSKQQAESTLDKDRKQDEAALQTAAKVRVDLAKTSIKALANGDVHHVFLIIQMSPADNRVNLVQAKFESVAKLGRTNIIWHFVLVRDRAKKVGDEPDVPQIDSKGDARGMTVDTIFTDAETCSNKALAVRLAMRQLNNMLGTKGKRQFSRNSYIGYVDLSNKIDLVQMIPMLAYCSQRATGSGCAAIGSRRLPESTVVGKPITFLARSSGLNYLIKALFPNLFLLSDTQTGFKLFALATVEMLLTAEPLLKSETLAFDVELLQKIAMSGTEIKEFAVDFADNTMESDGNLEQDKLGDMTQDLLEVRARYPDSGENSDADGYTFFNAGAENIVYSKGKRASRLLLKVPHERADTDFSGWLKYFVFRDREAMTLEDQNARVVGSDGFQSVLNMPFIGPLVTPLRNWKQFNAFVMKGIAAYENKNFKSAAYSTVYLLGKDLVVPYRLVPRRSAYKIDGQLRQFDLSDEVKESKFSPLIFKVAFVKALELKQVDIAKQLICSGVLLTLKMWYRGLYDLDTNFMVDMGFYSASDALVKDSQILDKFPQKPAHFGCGSKDTPPIDFTHFIAGGSPTELSLQILDPGELMTSKASFDVAVQKEKLEARYDFFDMKGSLQKAVLDGSITDEQSKHVVDFYKTQMLTMFDILTQNEASFGQEAAGKSLEQFQVEWEAEAPSKNSTQQGPSPSSKMINSLKQGKYEYQPPFRINGSAVAKLLLSQKSLASSTIYALPLGVSAKDSSVQVVNVRHGSVEPILSSMMNSAGKSNSATLVLLDGGSATRSGIMKYANNPQTKGNLNIHGRKLRQHVQSALAEFAQSLPREYIVFSSCDDLLSADASAFGQISRHINLNRLDFFWLDNDDPERAYPPYPMTQSQSLDYVKAHLAPSKSNQFIATGKQIPVLLGSIQNGYADLGLKLASRMLDNLVSFFQTTPQTPATSNSNGEGSSLSALGPVMAQYMSWLSYNAIIESGGSKVPFLFVMTRTYAKKILELLNKHFSDDQYGDLTWEVLLVRSLKMDKLIWSQSKVAGFNAKNWNAFYDDMQDLKRSKGIFTRSDLATAGDSSKGKMPLLPSQRATRAKIKEQMSVRLFKGAWQNFDDPYSLMQYMKSDFASGNLKRVKAVMQAIDQNGHAKTITDHELFVIADSVDTAPVVQVKVGKDFLDPTTHLAQSRFRGTVALVSCRASRISLTLVLDKDNEPFWRPGNEIEVLLYNIQADGDLSLISPNNFLTVEVKATSRFLTSFLPDSKDKIKKRPIYSCPPETVVDLKGCKELKGMDQFKQAINPKHQ